MTETVKGANRGGLIFTSILVLAAVFILVGLGTWQLKRLEWKEGIIALIEERQNASAISLQEAENAYAAGELIDMTRVQLSGTYEHGRELHLYITLDGRPGWRVITPMILADGKAVLVDRGFIPEELKSPETRSEGLPTGLVTISGNVRFHGEEKGIFIPDNEPAANKWFWYDRSNMLAAVGDKINMRSAPFFVQLETADHSGQWPQAVKVNIKISNSHLGYALTWFALGVVLIVMYIIYLMSRRKRNSQ